MVWSSMRQTRSSSSATPRPDLASSSRSSPKSCSIPASQGGKIHCPFRNYNGCHGGVGGRGFAKSVVYKHLLDRHFPTENAKAICKDRIQQRVDCFEAWEQALQELQWWLCIRCLRTHAWKKPCWDPSHPDVIIAGPSNGNGADFLISDIVKPRVSVELVTATQPNVQRIDNIATNLTIEMLNLIYQRQITTTEFHRRKVGH